MRFFTPLLGLALLAMTQLHAEGTRQLAPNGSIDIMGNATTDIAALHIDHPSYNNFGAYDNPNPQSRLFIHIKNPATECIYLGFNWAHNNLTSPNPPRINFEYRIKDPNGNIVFGPVTVTPVGANIQTWAEGFTGPMQINGPGGYNAVQANSQDLGSQGWTGAGDYYIEFKDVENNDFLIDFWDITVVDCSTINPGERKGRVWSYNWSIFAINDFGFPNRPFNGAFYICAPDPDNIHASFVTKIDFNQSGFSPAAFNIAFNSFGSQNTGDVSEDRKSIELVNSTQAEYAIFLNDPVDICETATVGNITILGISRCSSEDYCIKFIVTKAGQIDLLLDFDGADNLFTPGTADVMVSHEVTPEEVGVPTCVSWNGLDGLGNPLFEDVATQIPILIDYAQGIYHFPIYDAELMTTGVKLQAVRPAASIPSLFYDDSNISVPSGSGEPAVQLSGCVAPCHSWTNYTQPNTAGFGNLNTINSWWFSQLIIREDVFFLPAYYSCEIEGPSHICQGGTSQLAFKPAVLPPGAVGGEILQTEWIGPGIIGSATGPEITIDSEGDYTVRTKWLNNFGDTCQSECTYNVTADPPLTGSIDTLILLGQTIQINGESYNHGGQFTQELTTVAGCDSILTINIIILNSIIHYDLEGCESFMSNGSHMDYSEFIPSYPQPLPCATIVADTLYRANPQMNKHSCTLGVNNSMAMCVSSLDGCNYVAGSDVNVVIEIKITPDPDTAVFLTGFSFFEKAPLTYSWVSGSSGPNNYPTLFGIRVLKNGVEIYRKEAIPTSQNWKEEVFDFQDNDKFLVKDPTTFRFELLPYCLVGNGADVAAWDMDEINIRSGCASAAGLNKSISGKVTTESGIVVPNVEMYLSDDPINGNTIVTLTDASGHYEFNQLEPEKDYYVHGYNNTHFLNGVSTLDLVRIQKHLLGIKAFDSPYQFIAADANKSYSVSAIDLLELRKLLLGIYTELPHNTSWRFGDASQNYDPGYPWLFNEKVAIEYLDEDRKDVDFIGVKIGDVNGDVKPDFHSASWTPRSHDELVLHTMDMPMIAGVPVRLDFTMQDVVDVEGMQLALKIDDAQIQSISSGALNLDSDNYAVASDGVLRISWIKTEPTDISPDAVLFSLMIQPGKNGSVKDLLHIRQDLLHGEAYVGEELHTLDIALEITQPVAAANGNHLFQNEPNPFSQSTVIRFQLEKSGYATLRFFDLSGQLLTAQSGIFNKGENSIEISATALGINNGVVLCQLKADNFVATEKMIILH